MTKDADEPLEAQIVELDYAGPRSNTTIGRQGKLVVVPLQIVLPSVCYKTGMDAAEAAAEGRRLITYDKTLYWAPSWTTLMAVAGFVIFLPLFIIGLVFYFVYRKKVRLRLTTRRDVWWRRTLASVLLVLLALGAIIVGLATAFNTEEWLPGVAGVVVAILAAYFASTIGRIIGVKTVKDEWAYLTGAGPAFLDRAAIDFEQPR